MRQISTILMVFVLIGLINTSIKASERVVLKNQAKEGLVTKYTVIFQQGFGDALIPAKIEQSCKVTVISVKANVITTTTETYEVTVNGKKLSAEQIRHDFPLQTDRCYPDGSPVRDAAKPDTPAAAPSDGSAVIAATKLFFSPEAVGVGDTWTHEYQASDADSGYAATLTFTLKSFANKDGREAAEIATDYRAKDNDKHPLTVNGTVWVERSTGDILEAEYLFNQDRLNLVGVPHPSITMRRIGGNEFDDERFIERLKGLHTIADVQRLDGGYYRAQGDGATLAETTYTFYKNGRFIETNFVGNVNARRYLETDRLGTYRLNGKRLELIYQNNERKTKMFTVTQPHEIELDGVVYKLTGKKYDWGS